MYLRVSPAHSGTKSAALTPPAAPPLVDSCPSKYVPSTTHTATPVTCRRYRPSPHPPGGQPAPRCGPDQAKKAKKEGAGEGKSLQNQTHRGCHAHTRKQHRHVRTNGRHMAYRTGSMSPFVFPPSLGACRLPQPAQLRPLPRHSREAARGLRLSPSSTAPGSSRSEAALWGHHRVHLGAPRHTRPRGR
jgi:hypothetical protein